MQKGQNRQALIAGVKAEYARLADMESRDSFVNTPGAMVPEAYYEKLLDQVLAGIDSGQFDKFSTGQEIVDAVAADKARFGITM